MWSDVADVLEQAGAEVIQVEKYKMCFNNS
jgi:hypothetical protein